MAKKVYLHVGLPKSGTTYLQAVLGENKERLKTRAGVLYPGERWSAQVLAARDVLSADPHGASNPATAGAWDRLVEEVAAWPGDAVVSMEWLGSASPAQARRMVDSFAPAETHVVVTARDLGRTVPAAWQEFMQNWEQWTWPEFLEGITSENPRDNPPGKLFWTQQDLGRLLAIWGDVLPPERTHVVTLPAPGAPAGELWSRFASVIGVDPGLFDASGSGSNESLGLESAELMRRLNDLTRLKRTDWPLYDEAFKHVLAKGTLAKRKNIESALGLPAEYEPWVRARSEEMKAAVKASGAQLVGDLSDLDPVFSKKHAQPEDVTDAALLEAALDGLVGLAQDRARVKKRLQRVEAAPRRAAMKERVFKDGEPRPGFRSAVALYRAGRRRLSHPE